MLAHGLLGFAELRVAGHYLPALHYWRGIREALTAAGAEVITTAVPPSAAIEDRAATLAREIAAVAAGRTVNIIAHSMGGLDARYMVSRLEPANVKVAALVTIATPHHGSPFADYLLGGRRSSPIPDETEDKDGAAGGKQQQQQQKKGAAAAAGETVAEIAAAPLNLERLYGALRRVGLGTGAFAQLTTRYMAEDFNPRTPDAAGVRYFSYGARIAPPTPLSPFWLPQRVIQRVEGPNDGLVSVASARWGEYRGTLVGVHHLDLINWTNRLRWMARRWWFGREES